MLTLQFIPYTEISSLSSEKKIQRLLKVVREDKIVLIEGKLGSSEKSELIRKTMEEIDDRFKGIEIEELDLNPIFAYSDGAVAVDARVILENGN